MDRLRGRHYVLKGTRCEPKPIQKPRPPILIGGRGERLTLRVVARHADVWNVPGLPQSIVDDFRRLNRLLDDHCAAIGRDPAMVARSVQLHVDRGDPAAMVESICSLVGAGAGHVVLNLLPPYPSDLVRWVVDAIIAPVRARLEEVAGFALS